MQHLLHGHMSGIRIPQHDHPQGVSNQKHRDPQFIQKPGHGVIVDGQRRQEGLAFESSNSVLTLLRRVHQTHY